jgi:simple sugar transport system permease protein
VFIFFGLVAGNSGLFSAPGIINFLEVSAQLGIIAVAASMLMAGGEFDLSIGSMIGAAGVIIAIPAVQWGWPLWLCILLAFAIACGIGYINGQIVIKSGLPSFIVTLAGLFILRGLTIGFTRMITGRTQVSGLKSLAEADWLAAIFAGEVGGTVMVWLAQIGLIGSRADGTPAISGIPMSIVWWIGLTAVATYILLRTRVGNWIFACGGDPNSARNVGVPVAAVKTGLFMFTACAATLFACVQVLDAGSADTTRTAQGIRGDHRRGDRRLSLDRRLRLRDRRLVRCADLRHRPDGHLLYRREHRLVQGVPGRDDADRGAVQQLHPAQGDRSAVGVGRSRSWQMATAARLWSSCATSSNGLAR